MPKLRDVKASVWLAGAAALLYNSWPLGYLLNPAVGHHQLASQLEAAHQPYRWLFVILDMAVGALLVACGYKQLQSRKSWLSVVAVLGYVAFGLMVAGAAAMPLDCDPAAGACGPIWRDSEIIIHGSFSIGSVSLLLLGSLAAIKLAYQEQIQRWLRAVIGLILGGWAVFGSGALISLSLHIRNNFLQDFFISVCSLSIIFAVAAVEYLQPQDEQMPVTLKRVVPG